MQRNFFASEHGKGQSDAETGLLSKKISDAIKARRVVINEASDMHTFLSKDSDKKHIFKLVREGDLDVLMEKFNGVKVQTLSGNCTRGLHQIKAGIGKGNILQRPYSCFCIHCRDNQFEWCLNKTVTLGEFKLRQLKSTDIHGNIDEEKENEENDENLEMNSDGLFLEGEVQLENLRKGDFVIVAIEAVHGRKKKIRQYVAKIKEIDDDEEIGVDYLKQDFDHPEQFQVDVTHTDRDQAVFLEDIVMVLPEPECRKGKYYFPEKLSLKQKF